MASLSYKGHTKSRLDCSDILQLTFKKQRNKVLTDASGQASQIY